MNPGGRIAVDLFKPNGKWYTNEAWRVPESVPLDADTPAYRAGARSRPVLGPTDMRYSPDFRTIDGGAVLVSCAEWGFPALLTSDAAHAAHHKRLHQCLDELLADYLLEHDSALPTRMSLMDLVEWSHEQTTNPGLNRHHELSK